MLKNIESNFFENKNVDDVCRMFALKKLDSITQPLHSVVCSR